VDRTLFIVKPDGVERGLIGEIIGRLEAKQLRIVAAEMRLIDVKTAERHYAEHHGKPYYDKLVEFMTQGPALVTIVEGPTTHGKSCEVSWGTNAKDAPRDDSR